MRDDSIPNRRCPRCKIHQFPSAFEQASNGRPYSYCRTCRSKITPPKNPAPLEDPNPSGLCRCGCGAPTQVIGRDGHGRARKGHHRNYILGHAKPVFTEHTVNPLTGCWIWRKANVNLGSGYGRATRKGERVQAHRWYWEQKNGPIPDGTEIDHLCENPRCVNPDHLEPVTHAENIRRGFARAIGKDEAA